MTEYMKDTDIAAARAAGGHYVGVRGKDADFVIPIAFLERHGVTVQVVRELSAQNEDGSLAQAGESTHDAVQFLRMTDRTILERHIPYLPGFHAFKAWTQESVDQVCAQAVNRLRIEQARNADTLEARARIDAQREQVQTVRRQTIQAFAEPKQVRADKVRTNSRVVTMDDGKVWTAAAVTPAGTVLISYPNRDTQRVILPDVLVLPFTVENEHQIERLIGRKLS